MRLFFFKHRQILGLAIGILFFVPSSLVYALPASQTSGLPPSQTSGPITTTPAPVVTTASNAHELQNPLKFKTVCGLVTGLLNAVMIIGVPIAVLFIIWAGFKFIIAQGNPNELGEARNNFLHVIIGIAIFLGASLIAAVIINTLGGARRPGHHRLLITCFQPHRLSGMSFRSSSTL